MSKYEFKKVHELPVIEELPDVLEGISTNEEWAGKRDCIKAMISHYMLGHLPENDVPATGEVISEEEIYGGKAVRAVVENHFCYYDPRVAKEHLLTDRLIAACCM